MVRLRYFYLPLVVAIAIIGCNKIDTSYSLPNGYKLFSPNSSKYAVAAPDSSVLVLPKVLNIGWTDKIIFGQRTEEETYGELSSKRGHLNFFIIDTQSGRVRFFLSKSEFEDALSTYQITDWLNRIDWENGRHRSGR